MAADDATVLSRPHSSADLDTVFDALSSAYRRAVVAELDWGEPATLDELAEVVAARVDDATAEHARLRLAHCHLPHLAEADVVTYDADDQVCELDDAVAARAVLSAVRTDV